MTYRTFSARPYTVTTVVSGRPLRFFFLPAWLPAFAVFAVCAGVVHLAAPAFAAGDRPALFAPEAPARSTAGAGAAADHLPHDAGSWVIELPGGCQARPTLPVGSTLRRVDLQPDGSWVAVGLRPGPATSSPPALLIARGGCGAANKAAPSPGPTLLDGPPVAAGVEVDAPEVAASGERIELAWLQGVSPRRYAVMASSWSDGDGWQPTREISPAGPGSQLALTSAVLTDGTVLLVWTRFDGRDDEIVWVRSESRAPAATAQTTWSAPQRVGPDNLVPDVSPSLLATADGGAWLAWTRYSDGEYEVVASRYLAGAFSAPVVVGPKGSSLPSFVAGAAVAPGPHLLYRLHGSGGWELARLGESGKTLARAVASQPSTTAGESNVRPVVWVEPGGVSFRWHPDGPGQLVAWK